MPHTLAEARFLEVVPQELRGIRDELKLSNNLLKEIGREIVDRQHAVRPLEFTEFDFETLIRRVAALEDRIGM